MSANKGKIAIIGSGLIGRSWSMLFASVGYNVTIYDIVSTQIDNALIDIRRQLDALEKSGMLRGSIRSAKQQWEHINGTSVLKECTAEAFFVLECVPEIFDIKRKALIEIDGVMDDIAILASSTSAILPSKLADGLKHKSTFIVTHPVNPPYYVPLVEIVPSPWTLIEVVIRTKALMLEIGQKPVTLKKECIGFALNRIQYALISQCYNLIEDGVMSPEDVDTSISEGLGRRYAFVGALQTCHLNGEGMRSYLDRYGKLIEDVSAEMSSLRRMGGNTARIICDSLNERIPLDTLQEARKRRDNGLTRLSKLRNEIDKNA